MANTKEYHFKDSNIETNTWYYGVTVNVRNTISVADADTQQYPSL